jgi:hypothetical protein
MPCRGWYARCQQTGGDWEEMYGTTLSGNLPQHKKHHHVGHKWAPCPYDTDARCSDTRKRYLLGVVPEGIAHVDADGKEYYMKTAQRGTAWGFECTNSGICPYYADNKRNYFYS